VALDLRSCPDLPDPYQLLLLSRIHPPPDLLAQTRKQVLLQSVERKLAKGKTR